MGKQEVLISLNDAINVLPDAAIVVNRDSVIIAVNLQIYNMFGYQPDELMHRELNILIPERFRKNHNSYVKQYFGCPVKRHMKSGNELFGLRRNGEEIDIDIALAPIQVGKEQMAIAIIRDITVIKDLERSLLKKNEDLSLTNTQLERLGYIIAHDLKSPLLNVHALVGMLNRELGQKTSPAVTTITKDMNEILLSMMDLITGVTEYSRIGFQDDSQAEVDLNVVAEDIRKLVHFPDNFTFEVKGNLPTVIGNRTKILQVFLNLVNNAIKYNDKPEGRIEIYAYPKDDMCLINVADNGPGIAPELQSTVFDLFRRGSHEKEGSTGIGLAVVKKIIEDHGGRISLGESELGGANFVFTWPARKDAPELNAAKSS